MSLFLNSARHRNYHTHAKLGGEKWREGKEEEEEKKEEEEEEERPAAYRGKPSDSFRPWLRACQRAKMREMGGKDTEGEERTEGERGKETVFSGGVRGEKGRKLMEPGAVTSPSLPLPS